MTQAGRGLGKPPFITRANVSEAPQMPVSVSRDINSLHLYLTTLENFLTRHRGAYRFPVRSEERSWPLRRGRRKSHRHGRSPTWRWRQRAAAAGPGRARGRAAPCCREGVGCRGPLQSGRQGPSCLRGYATEL